MAIRLPEDRRPTHPGEVIRREYLEPTGVTQAELAERLHISRVRLNEIVGGRRSVTPDTALRLAKFFGNDAGFWLNLQVARDLWDALHSDASADIAAITPIA